MDPSPLVPHTQALGAPTPCYLSWRKVSVALRYGRIFPWTPEAWRDCPAARPVTTG